MTEMQQGVASQNPKWDFGRRWGAGQNVDCQTVLRRMAGADALSSLVAAVPAVDSGAVDALCAPVRETQDTDCRSTH